jgi:hypothetical protein
MSGQLENHLLANFADGADAYKWRKRRSMYIGLTKAGESLRLHYN